VPILAVTAGESDDDPAAAETGWMSAGMDGVVYKPFDGDAFRAIVARFVAAARVDQAQTV
jgi:CheY-like chemotaxis protein